MQFISYELLMYITFSYYGGSPYLKISWIIVLNGGKELWFYPRQIPVNYTICFKKAILSKVKNRFNQDYYS